MSIRAISFRKSILALIGLGMSAALAACGGNGGTGTTPPAITVTMSTTPPATMTVGANAPLAAQIAGDTTDSGVVWSCSPGNSSTTCGQFSSSNSVTTTYTAPSVTGSVTITVASVHDNSATASAKVTIVPPLLPNGNYVYSLSGTDQAKTANNLLSAYYVAGAFTVLNGVITAGEQDSVDSSNDIAAQINPAGSSLTQTADGNLQIVLAIICQSCTIGVNNVETFNASFLPQNSSKANITEFDTSAAASGTLELQDAAAISVPLSQGYAFAVNGLDGSGNPAAIGGIIYVPNPGTVGQGGSIFDINDFGTVQLGQIFTQTGTVTVHPDGFGRVEFDLIPNALPPPRFNLIGYIVDTSRIQ
ncbi:MAG: hypothetical protein ABSC33_17905, partial [Candidatus Sulfotelmatobacter sp.]